MAPDLEAELSCVAGARDHDRPLRDAADQEPEPFELFDRRLMRRRRYDIFEDIARSRPLQSDVVQLVGRRSHPNLQTASFGYLTHPDAKIVVTANDTEIVLTQTEDSAVVDHAAMLVAERGVDHLPLAQLSNIAGGDELEERLGIRPGHLKFAQGAEIHDHGLLPARPVFLDGLHVGEAGGQPEAAV